MATVNLSLASIQRFLSLRSRAPAGRSGLPPSWQVVTLTAFGADSRGYGFEFGVTPLFTFTWRNLRAHSHDARRT